jgi:hypothetical protein
MEIGKIIGSGSETEIYYIGNNQVLKIFYKFFSELRINYYEFYAHSAIQKVFSNCPECYKKIEKEGRIGIIYEFIEGA